MIKKETIESYARGEVTPTEVAQRTEKLLGSNCSSVILMSFVEEGRTIRVLVKKSRLGAERLEKIREEYNKLRRYLADLVPMQAFITEKRSDYGDKEMISAFCSPVTIAYDIFGSEENFAFLKKELEQNQDLQSDVDLFISGYQELAKEGFHIDLWGDENLVVTREGRLKYIDSFMIDMTGRKSLLPSSEARFRKIESLKSTSGMA